MATTIQLPIELKKELDQIKKPKMSYAEIIEELIKQHKKRENNFLLQDYAEKYGKESVEEVNEWSATETWD